MHRSPSRWIAVLAGTALVLAACAADPAATPDATDTPSESPTSTPTMDHSDMATASASPEESEAAEPTDAASEAPEVQLGMSSFSPTALTVAAGTEVTFINNSGLPHTVTHGTGGRPVEDPAFDRSIGDGATITITFDEPGTYDVTCKIHPTMQMTITVEG